MITLSRDELKALLGVGAALIGLAGGGGFSAGRMTAPVPPVPPAVTVEVPVPYIVEVPIVPPAPEPEAPKSGELSPATSAAIAAAAAAAATVPMVKPIPPIAKPDKRARPPAAKKKRDAFCDQVRAMARSERARIMALPFVERAAEIARVLKKYSSTQISETRRRCGV
jgi:hypothetical protein